MFVFQVTLTAEEDCRYVSWRRRRLFSLMSKERYVCRLFAVMLGYDIAEKLYNLNNKLYIKSGVLLDIRLPSLYHVLAPPSQSSEGEPPERVDRHPRRESDPDRGRQGEDPIGKQWPSDPELPSGEDSTSLVLEDFADMPGSLTDYGSERDYLR